MKYLYSIGVVLLLLISIQTAHADGLPSGCLAGYNFSPTTGLPCTTQPCQAGDLFNSDTGQPCGTTLPAGCNSVIGYSPTTGNKCDGTGIANNLGSATAIVPQDIDTTNDPLQISFGSTYLSGNNFMFPIDLKYSTTSIDSLVVTVSINGNVDQTIILNTAITNTVTYPSPYEAIVHYQTTLPIGNDTISVNADGQTQSFDVTVPASQ